MFENIFKKLYKSKKTVSVDEKKSFEKELNDLKKELVIRKKQIEKFNSLIIEDPTHKKKYFERMDVHKKFVLEAEQRIKEIEIILLDS